MVERYTLKNGIPVFIVENHAAPVVSIQAWFRRGSTHEADSVAGISHFLEHSLFKGTKRRKVGEIALEIESRGGEINAFTSFEETAYYATLASRYFEDGLDVIADAVQNPLFDKDEMAREREVILEEIKRAQDSPYKMVSTNLWKSVFAGTPFGRPVLGFEETVRKIDHKKLKQYFDSQYHAGTASVFIVGAIDKQKALASVQKRFSKMKARPVKKAPAPISVTGSSVKVITLGRDVKECHVQIGFPVPAINDAMIPALDLMCSAIGQGESSRLYQTLVKDKKLALEAHMGLAATGSCGLAAVSLVVPPERLEAAIAACFTLLREIAATGIRESEVERVKTSLEAEVVGGKETVEGYARRLGYYYVQFGDPNYEQKYLDAVFAVNRFEAQNALGFLLGKRRVLSMVHPTGFKPDKAKLTALLKPDAKQKNLAEQPTEALMRIEKDSLRFVVKSVNNLPIISLRLLFPGGAREEDPSNLGLAHLFQRCWTAGTKKYSSLQIAQTLEGLGASLYAFSGRHTVGISAEFLSKHWPIVKPILTEVLLEPAFSEDEFATEKELTLREILSEKDSAGQVCQQNFLSLLYGEHPYGRSSSGTTATVGGLTTKHLRDYFKSYIHRGNLVVSTVGNFESEAWADELSGLLHNLHAYGKTVKNPQAVKEISKLQTVVAQKSPLFQSHLLIGFLGASIQSQERYALKLLSSCLAGQGGRLFLELRDKQSLAYQVSPLNSDSPERGIFGFYIGCSPEKLERAIQGIRGEIDKVLQTPIGRTELERAKEYWLGRFELDLQRYASQSMMYGLDEMYSVGFDHAKKIPEIIQAISADDIQTAAQKYLVPPTATISVVHPTVIDKSVVEKAWNA